MQAGQTSCKPCPQGGYADTEGSSQCTMCPDFKIRVRLHDNTLSCEYPVSISNATAYTLIALSCVCCSAVLLVSIIVIIRRHHKVIVAASSLFLLAILCGLLGLTSCIVISVLPQTPTLCTTFVWTLALSVQTLIGCLLLKLFRIYRIFCSHDIRVVVIKNAHLTAGLLLLLTIDIVVLAIWQAVSPYAIESEELKRCESTNQTLFLVILLLIKAPLVIACLFFAYSVRSVPGKRA